MAISQKIISRRTLIRSSAAMSLGIATVTSPASGLASKSLVANKTLLMSSILENQSPMNAANLAPALARVLSVQQALTEKLNRDVSFVNRRNVVKAELADSKSMIAEFMGIGDVDDLALVRNTSEANSIVVNGLDLAGGEVLVWNENHATNRRSWQYRMERYGDFLYREFSLPSSLASATEIVNYVRNQLKPETRVVSFSELSNISGKRLPAELLCKAIHAANPKIFIHVDGAQTLGNIPVNVEEMGCDSYSASCHKWLMGPRGTGVLYVRAEWAKKIWPSTLGYAPLFDYPLEELPDTALRFECFGQRDVAAHAAIGEAVKVYQELGGIDPVAQRIKALTDYCV